MTLHVRPYAIFLISRNRIQEKFDFGIFSVSSKKYAKVEARTRFEKNQLMAFCYKTKWHIFIISADTVTSCIRPDKILTTKVIFIFLKSLWSQEYKSAFKKINFRHYLFNLYNIWTCGIRTCYISLDNRSSLWKV